MAKEMPKGISLVFFLPTISGMKTDKQDKKENGFTTGIAKAA
jgi:hypothetical protein